MLLRRVIEHVREQNWTAVGIDFVVVGVFVGIQVANLNAERERSRDSALFTARLKDDLREENWRYQFLVDYHRDVQAAARKAADALDGKARCRTRISSSTPIEPASTSRAQAAARPTTSSSRPAISV